MSTENDQRGRDNPLQILSDLGKRDGFLWLLVYVALGLGGGSSFLVASDRTSTEAARELELYRKEQQTLAMEVANLKSNVNALMRESDHKDSDKESLQESITDFEARLRVIEHILRRRETER